MPDLDHHTTPPGGWTLVPRGPLASGQYRVNRKGLRTQKGECISFAERVATFWALVDKGGQNGCWIWNGGKCKDGYGYFYYKGKRILAHRFAWLATYGKLPEKPFLCHVCDNPPCCNPAHLFPGTNLDNILDASKKGRTAHGEKGYRASLKHDQVMAILGDPRSVREIASEYKASEATIRRVKHGQRYHREYLEWKSKYE